MPPTPPADGRARSTAERIAELNAAIRALFPHRDVRLSDAERAEYQRLLAELDRVGRGDVTTAV